jgi:Tfp pilus assembly protein PilF
VANEEVQIAAYQPPVQIRPEPVNTSAVTGLLEKADQQQQAGDMIGAAANLERALRIEPRNAHLWNRLAHVRLSQQQFAQAQDLASKSNSLAGADRWLHQNNWQLIAEARRMSGDLSGARAAEQKAADLR